MFSRKFSTTIQRRKRLIISTIISLILILGIGYAAFYSDFSFTGNLTVSGYMEPTLYNVLKKEAVTGGLAREYTGSHGDSMDSSKSTEKIYHWYTSSQALDKNNVIFAGHCWQMLRTTDTGGVKMIYNGEAENSKCLNTRGNHIGYGGMRTTQNLASNYWYGTDYTYDKTNKVFSISGTTEQATWSESTGPNLIGKYTCKGSNKTDTCATLYLIESYDSATIANVISLNSNSNYSQFGTLQYNVNYRSPADVGYMYNTRYTRNEKIMTSTESMLSSTSLNTTYYYGDSVTWGTPTANAYNLVNAALVSSTDDYPGLVGKYTFRNTSQTYTNSSVYYITGVNGSTMYYMQLYNSGNHTLTDFNDTYTYGDSYTDNGNGTYTIKNQDESNPTAINRSDWYTSYSSVGTGKYVCKNATNDTCSELWYTTSTSNTSMTYMKVVNIKYAKSFTWDGSKYILDNDTSVSFWNINDSTNKTSLNNAHYTCWNENGKCTNVSYIFHLNGKTPYYINIADGKSVDDAKNEMLYNNDVNQINSAIKSGVDAWYKHYLLEEYDDYIEDTIFCNDRSQIYAESNGWNPNGGNVSVDMNFKGWNVTSDLSCTNETDKFSISNNKAQLNYKVGLISSPEMNILNNSMIRKTGQNYWLASPHSFSGDFAYAIDVNSDGSMNSIYTVNDSYGVRPAVSLTPGTRYSDGDGSMEHPYYVGDVYTITNSNSLFKVREKAAPGYEVQIYSDDYAVTSFKLNGTTVNGDTFTMPEEDVTITDITYVVANYTITNTDSDIIVPNTGRYNTTITLESENYKVRSFKLNGTLVSGNSFTMPNENVTITDISKTPTVTIESDHNPYSNSINNQIMYENTFENATSLTVELTYQTEGANWDWIYLYDSSGGSPINNKKYGGSTLTTETITVNTNYLKIVFRTDGGGNNYYGFKAVIIPNYD